jgi:hypothetical protein
MNVDQLEIIKEKIEKAKQQKAKAEGALEKILDQWKEEYGCASIEEAQQKHDEISSCIEKEEERLNSLLNELEKITDWGSV